MTSGETTLRTCREHPGDAASAATFLAAIDMSGWDRGTFEVIHYHGRVEFLAVRGRVAEHVDQDFPSWGYILVLQVDAASLIQRGLPPCPLAVGDIVEFRADRRHRLVQGDRSTLVWLPLDSHERLGMDEVQDRFHDLITNPATKIAQTG